MKSLLNINAPVLHTRGLVGDAWGVLALSRAEQGSGSRHWSTTTWPHSTRLRRGANGRA